ncbi:MAG TPA: hypothetical protein VN372_14175 [Methanospirillum sp.]|nr:hypothetical protein [Methanospirillum sp.]
MFNKIRELFKSKESRVQEKEITIEELSSWLECEEDACTCRRSEAIGESRLKILDSKKVICDLMSDFGCEDNEQPLHPKVEQVNRHNLPQFKRRIETAVEKEFSEDDEVFYRQVAEMVDGCFKAFQGPGRYLHHLYPDEVKLFRQYMDQTGRELNHLTEAIKESRDRLGRIKTIRSALEKLGHISSEEAVLSEQRCHTAQNRQVLEDDRGSRIREREGVAASDSYQEYVTRKSDLESARVRTLTLYDDLESLIRTALPVWRKGLRILQDQRRKDDEKMMDHLIQYAVLQKYQNEEFSNLVRSTASGLFEFIEKEEIPLKNSFEKSLFTRPDEYAEQIITALDEWADAEQSYRDEHHDLENHPAFKQLSALDEKIHAIEREISHLDEESGRSDGKAHHLDRERAELISVITTELAELSVGTVRLVGWDQLSEVKS